MRSVLRSLASLLSLFSLLATMMPSFAWACPITGLVGSPTQICAPSAPCHDPSMAGMPCCRQKTSGKSVPAGQPCLYAGCCHPVIALSPSAPYVVLSVEKSTRVSQPAPDAGELTFLPIVLRAALVPDQSQSPPLYRFENFRTQSHSPLSLHSGRAPPVDRQLA